MTFAQLTLKGAASRNIQRAPDRLPPSKGTGVPPALRFVSAGSPQQSGFAQHSALPPQLHPRCWWARSQHTRPGHAQASHPGAQLTPGAPAAPSEVCQGPSAEQTGTQQGGHRTLPASAEPQPCQLPGCMALTSLAVCSGGKIKALGRQPQNPATGTGKANTCVRALKGERQKSRARAQSWHPRGTNPAAPGPPSAAATSLPSALAPPGPSPAAGAAALEAVRGTSCCSKRHSWRITKLCLAGSCAQLPEEGLLPVSPSAGSALSF